ncbi:MAG: hypothetical protein NZ898_07960 [Myxococcota bacterium]|nr:hypothetical protein [Myxococcota bacterium]MDW8363531.1 hypothetical protein [Myxococcales bacterium]
MRRTLPRSAALLVGIWSVPAGFFSTGVGAQAPAPSEPRPVGAYTGVVPGMTNPPPMRPANPRPAVVTWPGFQSRPDGASRVFVQTSAPVRTEIVRQGSAHVLLLRDCSVGLRNHRRPLETQYFETPVLRVHLERRGRDVAVVMQMRAEATPTVSASTGPDGLHYVYVEFPAGRWLPDTTRGERQPAAMPAGG